MSNATKPIYLSVVPGGKVQVSPKLASVGDRSRMNGWFADAVHSLINNTFRECGLECEGGTSEMTWDYAQDFANTIMDVIGRDVDATLEHLNHLVIAKEAVVKTKQEQLADALATVERLKKELVVE